MKITGRILAAIALTAMTASASDVQWTRFRGKVKAVNYKTQSLTIETGGDLVTVKVDEDVTIKVKDEMLPLKSITIDDKVTLLYAPKAAVPKDDDQPENGFYKPVKP